MAFALDRIVTRTLNILVQHNCVPFTEANSTLNEKEIIIFLMEPSMLTSTRDSESNYCFDMH